MKDKLETLTILQLRELAKHEGLKKFTALNKQDLVALLVEHYEAKLDAEEEDAQEDTDDDIPAIIENNTDPTGNIHKNEASQYSAKRQPTDDKIPVEMKELDSGIIAHGILEVMPDCFGFIRC